MKRLQRKRWLGLALAGALVSCGGSGQDPAPLGGPVINSGVVPQSFPVDAPISVQMTQWQPINVTITQGMTLTMTVDATGAPPLVYSWRDNNVVIDGASSPRLEIRNIQPNPNHIDHYTVTVANSSNIVISQAVIVTVVPHVAPSTTSNP